MPDGRVIKELQERGQSEAEAIHKIAAIVAEDIWHRMKLKDTGEGGPDSMLPEMRARDDAMNEAANRRIRDLVEATRG